MRAAGASRVIKCVTDLLLKDSQNTTKYQSVLISLCLRVPERDRGLGSAGSAAPSLRPDERESRISNGCW